VHDCIFVDFPAKNTVYAPYIYIYIYIWFRPTLHMLSLSAMTRKGGREQALSPFAGVLVTALWYRRKQAASAVRAVLNAVCEQEL